MDVKIYLVSSEALGMAMAVDRLAQKLDELCVAKLEAQAVEFECPDIDLPDLPIHCCGPWNITVEEALTPLDLSRLKQQLTLPERVAHFKEATRRTVDPKPYQGYMNGRPARRYNRR